MYESQLLAAKVLEKLLTGINLDKSFDAVFNREKSNNLKINESQIKALTYGTVRFLGQSKFKIEKLARNKIDNKLIESLLCVVFYQLSQEKFNDFTIVDQAVNAAKKIDHRKGNFVNAILRNYLRKKIQLNEEIIQNHAARYSYQDWWVQKIKKEFPSNWEQVLNIGNNHPPLTLRINKRKISKEKYTKILEKNNIEYQVISEVTLILKNPINVNEIPGFSEGYFSVQDYGAQLAAGLLDLKKGHKVLDACAAPGGKTCHMLESEDINLTALEVDKKRKDKITDNLKRLDLCANVINDSLSENNSWWKGELFDRILLDVPCSASGIVRRHVDIKWLRQPGDLKKFSETQYDLLRNAWRMLADRGKLLYVTCSIFEDENNDVIDKFKKVNSNATEIEITLPSNIEHQKNQLLPSEIHDGLFYALFEKK